MLDLQGKRRAQVREGGSEVQQSAAVKRGSSSGRTGRLQVAFAAMALTFLIGLGHPVSIPQAWAQSSPVPFDLIGDQPQVSLLGNLPAHDPTVGTVAGSGGVTGGAATYEIPIIVPPGRRGMQPALSLGYSSRSGNGIAGMGWSLSGLSSLHRCPMTLAQDGQIRAVQLDTQDKLCLDGQRLIATSGTYGTAGATYGTELESFVRVTQFGGDLGSASTYFRVERKSGEIAWYGGTSTAATPARVIPGGVSVPLTWMVSVVLDRADNAMHYAYTSYGEGETLVNGIWYTGNSSTLGTRRVSFTYEDRPSGAGSNDRSSSYLAGGVTRQTKRLTAVTTFADDVAVRSWVLNYGTGVSASTGRSLLQSVSDCAYDGANWICKSPTTFAWQQGAPTYAFNTVATGLPALAANEREFVRPAGDFDGDGASEMLVHRAGTPGGHYIVSMTPERQSRWTMPIPAEYGGFWATELQDFNQDGRIDLIGFDANWNVLIRPWSGDVNATSFSLAFGTVWNTGVPLLGMAGLGNAGLQINDMDGDGRADLVITGAPGNGTSTCEQRVRIYRNTPNPSTPQGAPTFPLLTEHCMNGAALTGVARSYESVDRIADFDGDGLMDLWIRSPRQGDGSQGAVLHRIAFGRRNPGYSLQSVPFNNLFVSTDPRSSAETKTDLFELWTDVNGDGLDDLIYLRSDAGGKWSLRMNRGGVMGPRHLFASQIGVETCQTKTRSASKCADAWVPWRSDKISVGDTDGDGRMEVLVPTRYAANICKFVGPNPATCPLGEGNSPDCWAKYYCPVSMPQWSQVLLDMNGDGTPETSEVPDRFYNSLYEEVGDPSLYLMTALQFVETSPGVIELRTKDTNIVSGASDVDLYGDGHSDRLVEGVGQFIDRTSFGIPAVYADGTPVPESISPRTLPGGLPLFLPRTFVNENIGPGGQKNPDGITPQTQDMLAVVTDGFGQQVKWSYSPLSGEAGRPAGVTPLYAVPTVPAQRYVDEQHIYFTSSMPVVAEMTRSDGIGGFRAWRYAYREAMYHTQGRGFQGFRTIIEEDVLAGLRTTTTFHQKFPLTSQPERVVVNPISRAGEEGLISRETYAWRCDRSNRANANACVPNHGVPTTYFPFLDTKESWTYDATTAAAGGTPATLGYAQEVVADSVSCSGSFSSTSGYDAYGNVLARTIIRQDLGSGSASGTANRLQRHCVSESNAFTSDAASWWLDRLDSKLVTTQVSWDSTQHPLPSGTANPSNTVTMNYTWNTGSRTLATETVQPGVTNQQRVTAYTYNAQGLPTGVAVSASGDPQSPRSTGTAYSADGYFPEVVTNALGHNASTQVRARDGQPTLVTDANGLRTLIDYDAFGFAVKKRFRGTTDAAYVMPDQSMSMIRCQPSFCWGGAEKVQVSISQDGAPHQLTRLDAMGRALTSAEWQFDGSWTAVYREFTALGQLSHQTEPFRNGEAWIWSSFLYNDILGRMTRKQVPKQAEDGRGDMVTTYSYSGRTTQISVTGSSGSGTVLNLSRTTDSLGRYVETVDAKSGRTRFWYESNGNVAAIEDAKGVITKAAYNAIGQRISVNDPNQGNWSFAYNALGEVASQTDARGIATAMTYDKLGRPASRSATLDVTGDNVPEAVVDNWSYDPANAKGAISVAQRAIGGALERSTTTVYDTLSRPVMTHVAQAGAPAALVMRTKYDSYYGRPIGQEFPNGEAVQVLYGNYGHALAEKDPQSGTEYRRLNSVNARSQPLQETFGNGVVLNAQYQQQTGQLTQLHYTKGAANVRKLGYGYDVFGNVRRQSLNDGASREDYTYDELQRMVSAIRSGAASGSISYGYDSVGNLTKKTDFSANTANAYSYTGVSCGGGANAVKSVALAAGGTRTYCYDANGSLVSDNAGLALQYDHQGMTVKATRGAQTDHFRYGPDGARTRSWGADGARVYLPGYELRTDTGETKVYVGDYAVISRTGATRKVEYLLKDRLGSVDAVTDSAGTVTETRGYDAFGKPRSGTWNDLTPPKLGSVATTPKGFTQHEHLNQLELIHMNGRVFDYALGRFFSVDPIIQFPLNSQSLNPYSYILNNPLSGTDPTGYAGDCPPRVQVCALSQNKLNALADGAKSVGYFGAKWEEGGSKEVSSAAPDNLGFNGGDAKLLPLGSDKRKSEQSPISEQSRNDVELETIHVRAQRPNRFTSFLRGLYERWVNDFSYTAWSTDYVCEQQVACGAGEGYSWEAKGWSKFEPYPDAPKDLEQEFGRNMAPAVAMLPAVLLRNPRAAGIGTAGDAEMLLYRYRNGPETATRLGKKAAEAEAAGLPHGVSTTTDPTPGRPCGVASCADVQRYFPVIKTGGPGHYTVELPKPVTKETADLFNSLFKDDP